jgi:O-antigen/teichoic acid export membrane protein
VLSLALTSGDRFVIAAFLGEGDVGAYSAGYQVGARILDIIFTWGAAAVTPILVAAYERGGPTEAIKAAHEGYIVRFGIGAPAALGLGLLAVPICEILIGESLRERAIQLVPWIALSALLAGMCDYFSEAFMLTKKALQRALLLLVPVVASLSLNVLLLPQFGLMGAAYANVAAYGLAMIMLAWIGRRYVALPIPLLETAKIAFACALMAGVVLAIPSFGSFTDLVLKGGLGVVSYGAFTVALNVAGARDFAKAMWTRLRPQTGAL